MKRVYVSDWDADSKRWTVTATEGIMSTVGNDSDYAAARTQAGDKLDVLLQHEPDEPRYQDYIFTHMLHRIWELLGMSLMLQADSDEERQLVQELMDKQQQSQYMTPLEW